MDEGQELEWESELKRMQVEVSWKGCFQGIAVLLRSLTNLLLQVSSIENCNDFERHTVEGFKARLFRAILSARSTTQLTRCEFPCSASAPLLDTIFTPGCSHLQARSFWGVIGTL